jgi:hypothetical protein
MTILGIDPGAHGAIAVLDDDGELKPDVSNRAIADALGVAHTTISRGAGAKAPPHEKEPPEIKGAKADPGANAPPGAADGTERDVASITVEVGGVVHLGHYSTRNGMIRVTYGSSCKATQLGGMENAAWVLARIILAEQAREALGLVGDNS